MRGREPASAFAPERGQIAWGIESEEKNTGQFAVAGEEERMRKAVLLLFNKI